MVLGPGNALLRVEVERIGSRPYGDAESGQGLKSHGCVKRSIIERLDFDMGDVAAVDLAPERKPRALRKFVGRNPDRTDRVGFRHCIHSLISLAARGSSLRQVWPIDFTALTPDRRE